MRILTGALALTLAAAALPAAAQNPQPAIAVAPGNALLTVIGEGRSRAAPDLAVFSAGVSTQGQTAAAALSQNAAEMTRVVESLRRAGIAERDIQTSTISVHPIYGEYERQAGVAQGPRIVGYQANNTVTVRYRDLRNLGRVIDALAAAGANQINGPSFQLEDDEAALREARLEAVREARQRADIYAEAAGMRIVRLLSIAESGGYGGPQPIAFARAEVAQDASSPIQPGQVETSTNVSVIYEMAPR